MFGHAVVGSVASGLVVLDDLRPSLLGVETADESKLRETGRLTDLNDATLLLRLGTSTLLTCCSIS
jgi:hypothetical protein